MGRFALVLAFVAGAFGAGTARADDVVVQRNVTVREAPTRQSDPVDFPRPGTRLDLLDEGARTSGYYHVRLPDGREGWVYYTFVRRVPDGGAVAAGVAGDRIAVHYIDVDQGAAALVETPCGAMLIDAGGRGTASGDHLIEYLDAFFSRRPDLDRRLAALFVTHTHVDHNSNLKRVAEAYEVGAYFHNGRLEGSGRNNARWMAQRATAQSIPALAIADVGTQPVAGGLVDPLACAGVDPVVRVYSGGLTLNPGWPAGEFDNGNNHSLVIRIDYGEASFLFTGDLEEDGIERVLHRLPAAGALDVDVYQVGHHGSYNATTAPLLAAMTPEIAVISMGPHNVQQQWTAWQYGHPRRTLVQLLDEVIERRRAAPVSVMVADGAKRFSAYPLRDAIYATGWDGDVVIAGGADGRLQVSTSRQP